MAEEENKKPSDAKAKEDKEEKKEEVKEEKKEETKTTAKEKAEEEEVKVPAKFKGLVEEIEKMNILDLAELVKILEKKFGVSAAPQMVAAAGVGASAGQEEEKNIFNVVLTGIGDKKIEVIKVVRDITQKGLKDSKDLVDAAASEPQVIKEGAKKEEAEEMKKKFEAAGAKIELK